MRSSLSVLLIVAISFTAGVISCVGGYWFLKRYLFPPDRIQVSGIVKFQAQSKSGESGPPPVGYYIETTATERFYLEGESVRQYLGDRIYSTGTLSSKCGPDGFPCYPNLIADSVRKAQ